MTTNRTFLLTVPILALGLGACGLSDPAEVQGVASALTYPDPTVIAATLVNPPSNLSASNIYAQFNTPAHGNWYADVRWMGDAQSNGNSIDCGAPSYEFTQEVASSVTWNPAPFTGLDCSGFGCNGSYQRGRYNDGVNGSGVFQAHGADFGSFINTWYFLHRRNIAGGGPHSVLSYDLVTPAAIYNHSGASTDSLFVQGYVQIPWSSEWSGAVGQYSLGGYLQDSVSGKVIEFLAFLYDNRGLPANSYLSSSNGQSYWAVPFTSYSPVASNGKSYGHPSGSSALGGSSPYSTARFFRFNVTQSELINVVTDLNAQYGLGLSTTATNYRLTGLHTLHEVFPLAQDSATSDCLPTGSSGITKAAGQVSMGTNTNSFAAYEAY